MTFAAALLLQQITINITKSVTKPIFQAGFVTAGQMSTMEN